MSSSQELNFNSSNRELVDFGVYYLDIVQCPLNPNHKMRRQKLPYHMLICEKNFPEKTQCPFGHYYYAHNHEMANHLKICPHKPRIQAVEMQQHDIVQAQRERNKNILVNNYDDNNFKLDEPYWD